MHPFQWIGIVVGILGLIGIGVFAWRRLKGDNAVTNAVGKAEATVAWAAVTAYLSDVLTDGSALKTAADAVAAAIKNHVVTTTDVTTDSAAAITALSAQVAELEKKLATQTATPATPAA